MELNESLALFRRLSGAELTSTLSRLERSLRGVNLEGLPAAVEPFGAWDASGYTAASNLKQLVGQLNVVIHALGILICLPKLLEPGETIEYVSLGAGNTGRDFDLETDRRVAEFKFIQWRGRDTIRQNSLFQDFFLMAEHDTRKQKFLYVTELVRPIKFLEGRRALRSVLSKNVTVNEQFRQKYGDQYRVVSDYFLEHRGKVTIQDVSPWLMG